MKNWSANISLLQKDAEKFAAWRLEQLINFGLDQEKINLNDLKKYWNKIKIDPCKKKFLALFI
ncbi:MAG: hypothetical protein A2047_02040 [Omnitrophica bacterium GWA2_41_15]|nr:MAG: hypothetical protein A2047_02040 [Omnitrophica bacterium GWA2_41_15]